MKFLYFFRSVVLLVSIVLFCPKNGVSQIINLIGDDDFPPYSFEENGEIKGIDVDLLREIAKRLDLQIKIALRPWKRLLFYTKIGRCDGSFSLFKTQEREDFAIFTEPLHHSRLTLFVRSNKVFEFNSIKDLYGKKIGKNLGFAISDEFDRAVKEGKINISETEGVNKNIIAAYAARTDGFVDNLHVTMYTLKKLGMQNKIIPLPNPVKENRGAYLVFSKKTSLPNKEKLINDIKNMIKRFDEDGTKERIIKKYLD